MVATLSSLILVILGTFLLQASGLPQMTPATTDSTPSTSATNAPILGIGCASGGGDARMDSFTVKRLSTLFCNKLLAHPLRFAGQNFSSAEYPSDLAPLPNNPNYTALESQGYIAVFDLTLSSSFIDDNGTIHKQGQQSQCASDNCLQIFNAIVNRCQWNTHYIGGYHQKVSPCGTYSMFTLNCTNNIVNSDCSRWHSRWQPSYTTTSTSTSYSVQLYTNTDNYQFTWTNPTTTMTSGVMVSTMTGPGWTTMTPLMYTIDSTNTGWVPNPTYDGPTFSPRSSSVATTSSPTSTMTRMGQSIPIETQLAN